MKRIFFLSLLSTAVTFSFAQTTPKTPVKTPVKTVAKPVNPLKNINDSASYAAGVSVANFYKQQGIKTFNSALVTKGMNDVFSGKKMLLDDQTCNSVMNNYISRTQAEKSKPTIAIGEKFLAANKNKPGVKVTASGLQYIVLVEGNGEKPNSSDSVTCHYRGTFINGEGFDSSYGRNPITFSLMGVIPGWTEALQLMSVGSKHRVYVPYTLGYGAFDYNSIPGGSMLIFDIELLAVRRKD